VPKSWRSRQWSRGANIASSCFLLMFRFLVGKGGEISPRAKFTGC